MALSLFLAVLTPSGSSIAAAPRTQALRQEMLVRVSARIRGFAQDGSRIAWLTGTDGRRCTRKLHVLSLDTHRTQTALQTGCTDRATHFSRLALAGPAAAWIVGRRNAGKTTEFGASLVTAQVRARLAHRVASIHGSGTEGYPEPEPKVAGAGKFLAYSTPTGIGRVVAGKARRLFRFTEPLDLSVGNGLVAVAAQKLSPGDGCRDDGIGCAWSPDWRSDGKIGFLSSTAPFDHAISLIDPSGAGRTVLTHDGAWRLSLDWSRDGTALAFDEEPYERIFLAAPDGSGSRYVAEGDEPALSPDASTLAYARFNYNGFAWWSLEVRNLINGEHRVLSYWFGRRPAWSPDGTRIAFDSGVGGYLWVVNADGSGLREVGPGAYPDWSPDGTKLAYVNGGIWTAAADGTNSSRLTSGPDFQPRWSPDGKALVFASERNLLVPRSPDVFARTELYVVNADGSDLRPLTFRVPAKWVTAGEVRSTTGRLLASFEASGIDRGVALAGSRVAVVTEEQAGEGTLTLFSSSTGAQLESVPLPGTHPLLAGGNERWIVYRTEAGTIRTFDIRDSTTATVAVAADTPIGLSVSGRRVAWAENLGPKARIRALTLPG